MKITVDDVRDKLNEYGLGLYTDYSTEDKGHCFMAAGMIVFLDEEDYSISITFKADTKPEVVATNILILKELKGLSEIFIMESFMYDNNNKFISGEKAHDIVKGSIIQNAFQKIAKTQLYNDMLMKLDCFNC